MGNDFESTWPTEPSSSSRWPPEPSNSPPLADVKESVVKFRLNPAAPAFQPSQKRQRAASGESFWAIGSLYF